MPDQDRTQDATREEIWQALEASVQAQSRYAEELNKQDGGDRPTFKNAWFWIRHLKRGGQ